VAAIQGDYGRAETLLAEGLTLFREAGDVRGSVDALDNLGFAARRRGEYARAAILYQESLPLAQKLGNKRLVAEALDGLAEADAAQGQPCLAARLFGSAEALREAVDMPLAPPDRAIRDRAVAGVRAVLGDEAFTTAWIAGRTMMMEEAIALALGEDTA
jgi:tetratricopeptide (TPR) repeat protein